MSSRKQGKLIELFVAGSTARAAAEVTGVQANTAIRFFMGLRRLISSKLPSYELSGEVEADESYFGGRRKGKRGRGAAAKVAVFSIKASWSFAKRRLAQFNGIREDKFILHLAKCQFRYNNRSKNLMDVLVNE